MEFDDWLPDLCAKVSLIFELKVAVGLITSFFGMEGFCQPEANPFLHLR